MDMLQYVQNQGKGEMKGVTIGPRPWMQLHFRVRTDFTRVAYCFSNQTAINAAPSREDGNAQDISTKVLSSRPTPSYRTFEHELFHNLVPLHRRSFGYFEHRPCSGLKRLAFSLVDL